MSRKRSLGRHLAGAVFGTLCLAALWGQSTAAEYAPVRLHMATAASPSWLARFNLWRGNAGVSALTENTTWSAGDYNHAVYMVKNDLVTHYETPGTPYYTTAGDTAAQNSNIYVSSSTATTDDQAIDWWMQAPFHAMGMMDPRLSSTGFGSYREVKSGWDMGAAVDVLRGNSFTGGTWPVFFPGNGTSEPLSSYGGGEFPDPLQACAGYSAPTGLPVFVEVGGNVSTSVTLHTFTGNGVALDHCVIDSSNPSVGASLKYRGGVVLIPRQPLTTGVRYVVALTVNGAAYTWSFSVGAFSSCGAVQVSTAPASPSPMGTSVVATASATCADPAPLFHFGIMAPGSSTYVLAQDYSTRPTYTWNTTGLAPGTYRFSVWARDANSAGVYGNSAGRWDAYNNDLLYTLTPTCSTLSVSVSPPSPAGVGATVTVSATCPQPNELYHFGLMAPGSSAYALAQDYSASPTYVWNTTGLVPGDYRFSVWARDVNSSGIYGNSAGRWDAYNNSTLYTLTGCAAVGVMTPGSQAEVGGIVNITASASGCTSPRYRFALLAPGAGSYALAQAYSASNSYSWNTAGLVPGTYRFSVWAEDVASGGASGNSDGRWDAYNNGAIFTLTGCGAVSVTVSPPSPSARGTTVTVTAHGSGCSSPRYRFALLAPGSGTYALAQAYSSSPTYTWNTTGLAAGQYRFSVWVEDGSSGGAFGNSDGRWDAYDNSSLYTLN